MRELLLTSICMLEVADLTQMFILSSGGPPFFCHLWYAPYKYDVYFLNAVLTIIFNA